jgi:hypothetical protein
VINRFGAYVCPTNADTAHLALKNENASIDGRGLLTFHTPLKGTGATPALAWQRRYPHIDGWIYPWTRAGRLRPGLTFLAGEERGSCEVGSEQTVAKPAISCHTGGFITDPCFPQKANWKRSGLIAACPNAPGDTTFSRFVISRTS